MLSDCIHEERDRLIDEHLCLVRAIAVGLWKKLPPFIELDELISAGNEGLVAAASAFDRAAGVKFSLFAKTRIHGAMIDHLRAADPVKRTTRTWQKRIGHIEASLGRPVTDEELAGEFHCTVARAREIRAVASVRLWSLDAPKSTGEKGVSDIACPRPSPLDVLASGELADLVKRAVAQLPPRYRYVLEMHYRYDVSMRQIGERIGVSRGRVSQIRAAAVNKLQAILHGSGLKDQRCFPRVSQAIRPHSR